MKQTAVEFIEDYLKFKGIIIDDKTIPQVLVGVINQAKEMERQQIVMAFWNSKHSLCDEDTDLLYLAEQYYKATFNK
jgi:hypothetical protein